MTEAITTQDDAGGTVGAAKADNDAAASVAIDPIEAVPEIIGTDTRGARSHREVRGNSGFLEVPEIISHTDRRPRR